MTRITLFVVLLAASSAAGAECAREDVEFFLSKGFTPAQITKLCDTDTAASAKPKYESFADEYVDRHDSEYQARLRIERDVFLRQSIEASNIHLSGGYLMYARKICVKEGVEKDQAFGLKACPVVNFRIKLAGLKVDKKEFKRRFLFGDPLIRVEGEIHRQVEEGAFSGIPNEYYRELLRNKLESGGETKIPLRSGTDFHFAVDSLKEIVNYETQRVEERAGGGQTGPHDLDEMDEALNSDS